MQQKQRGTEYGFSIQDWSYWETECSYQLLLLPILVFLLVLSSEQSHLLTSILDSFENAPSLYCSVTVKVTFLPQYYYNLQLLMGILEFLMGIFQCVCVTELWKYNLLQPPPSTVIGSSLTTSHKLSISQQNIYKHINVFSEKLSF